MKKISFHQRKSAVLIQVMMILSWLTYFQETEAYFFTYCLVTCAGLFCIWENYRKELEISHGGQSRIWIAAAVFSILSIMANYSLFEPFTSLTNLVRLTVSFLGGWSLAANVLIYLLQVFPGIRLEEEKRDYPGRVFALSFGVILMIDLIFLILVEWPGILTSDSINQMREIVSGHYSNANPYWHTKTIGIAVRLGLLLTGDLHWGIAVFCIFQICFMAGCFSYVVMTLWQKRVPKWCIAAVWAVYALIPYNIIYSVTVWKDILFSGASLLLTVSLYRLICPVDENSKADWVLLVAGGLGLCLWRTNGILVIFMLFVILLLSGRKNRKMAAALGAVLAAGLVLCGPVLSAMGIQGAGLAETLSIPLQQVARVVYDGAEVAQEDMDMIRTIAEPEEIVSVYESHISDPMKNLLRKSPGYDRLQNDPLPYVKLWVRMGLRHPAEYVKAWIDQTKGYWNAGYFYWITADGIFENELGLETQTGDTLRAVFNQMMRRLELAPLMHPLVSIGLHTWLAAACCLINRLRGKKEWMLSVPWMVILFGLLIGTPVYSEFRYAYPVMLASPLILTATFIKESR